MTSLSQRDTHDIVLQEWFQQAQKHRNLKLELSGAMGVRTKFQTKQTAQVSALLIGVLRVSPIVTDSSHKLDLSIAGLACDVN